MTEPSEPYVVSMSGYNPSATTEPYVLSMNGREVTATEEQAEIIRFACDSPQSLLVNALAGAAKTSTLQFICKYHPVVPILSLAFNKRIAEEMKKRLPGHVNAATMNSVGHRVWSAAVGKRLIVDIKKTYNLLKDRVDALSRHEKGDAYDAFGDIMKAVSAAKLSGYVPSGVFEGQAKRLVTSDQFFGGLDEEPEGWFCDLVNRVLADSCTQSYAGVIDFDDQIYMPTLFGGSFPQYPLILGDEAQDFSSLNIAMMEKLVTKRLIAVGDPFQSIYAFRGAVTSSMARLKERFNMHEMTLSISFRCPINVVKKAHERVPHMRWPDWAVEGRVERLDKWDAASVPDGAAIICRNNAPLFSCALSLLRSGRGVHLVGTDLGPQLIKTLKKLGDPSMPQEKVYDAIDAWERERRRKARNEGSVADKADCLRVFAGFGPTLNAAIAYAEHLFSSHGPIQLLSGHKAKGLEWDIVYHLDPERIPSPWARSPEDIEQELNVRYVIETRAKRELLLVSMTGFEAEAE